MAQNNAPDSMSSKLGRKWMELRHRFEETNSILLGNFKAGKIDKEIYEGAIADNEKTYRMALSPIRDGLIDIEMGKVKR